MIKFELVKNGYAYYCFCEPERLEEMRKEQTAKKQPPIYDRFCLQNVSEEEINKNFRVHRVRSWRSKKELCYPWEQVTYLIFGWFKCKELLKTKRYDLCHCHFIIPTGVLALKLKKKFGLPYIITPHGSDVLNYNSRLKLIYPFTI